LSGAAVLISIRKTGDELERKEGLIHSAKDSFRHAILSTARYAVELDPGEANDFREHLRLLHEQVESAEAPENWLSLQSSFRGELRDYRDRAANQLAELRQQIKVAGEAVQLFAENAAAIDSDHEAEIKGALKQLNVIADSVNPELVGSAIRSAANTISESIQLMRRRHQMALAELRQEIRVLHKQIDGERKAQLLDAATGVWNRQKLDLQVVDLLDKDQPFCILLVYIRNIERLNARYPRTLVDAALKSLLERFAGMLSDGATIGRWDGQHFAAILEIEPAAAIAVSRLATKKLAGDYSVQDNGVSHTLSLQATAGVIDRAAGSDESAFRKKLSQMLQVLSEQ
jgi:GGDEF domain-containing protein